MSDNITNLPASTKGGEPTDAEVEAMARVLAAQELARDRAKEIVKEQRKSEGSLFKRAGKATANGFRNAGTWVSETVDTIEAKREEREVKDEARELAEKELVESKMEEARRIVAARKEQAPAETGEADAS